jgi:hypothetical protein
MTASSFVDLKGWWDFPRSYGLKCHYGWLWDSIEIRYYHGFDTWWDLPDTISKLTSSQYEFSAEFVMQAIFEKGKVRGQYPLSSAQC